MENDTKRTYTKGLRESVIKILESNPCTVKELSEITGSSEGSIRFLLFKLKKTDPKIRNSRSVTNMWHAQGDPEDKS